MVLKTLLDCEIEFCFYNSFALMSFLLMISRPQYLTKNHNFINKPERIKYINKEKTAQCLATGGLKVPKSYGDHRRFLDNSIATERDLVNQEEIRIS